MKSVVKYLSLFILLVLAVAVALLFVPPVTRGVTQMALQHFLKVEADVAEAALSYRGLQASGTIGHNDTFALLITPTSFTSAAAELNYSGDLHTFSALAGTTLPYVRTDLNATFQSVPGRLSVNAALLQGALKGTLDLKRGRYRLELNDLNLTSFRLQQPRPMPEYATGLLSARGRGSIDAPYHLDFALQSSALQLEENATALLSPKLKSPLALNLDLNGSVDTNALNASLELDSTLAGLKSPRLGFDFNTSRFALELVLLNHDRSILPIKSLALDLNGTLQKQDLNSSFALSADGYRLGSSNLHYALDSRALNMDYTLTSLEKRPLNLQGEFALYGSLDYRDDDLSLTTNAKALNSPILLTIKKKRLELISNNISLGALQQMADREIVAKGDAALFLQADLAEKPLLWKASVKSGNLALPLKYREAIGLKNDLQVALSAQNDALGEIFMAPSLKSNILVIDRSLLRYLPSTQTLSFDINASKLKTPYYRTAKLNVKGAYRLKTDTLETTVLRAPHDKIVIEELRYSKEAIKSHIRFATGRLDRFGDLNRTYRLSAKSFVQYTPDKISVSLSSKQLGHLDLVRTGKVIKVSGRGLGVEQIMQLTGRPVTMKGKLAYKVRYTPSALQARISSAKLSGQGGLKALLRPFTLDSDTALTLKGKRFQGETNIRTGNETLRLSKLTADLAAKSVTSRYRFDVKALERSTYILPQELKGPLHLQGDFAQNKKQRLTLGMTGFQLPKEWHRKLDANATGPLETNATLKASSDGKVLHFDAKLTNRLLQLTLRDSTLNLPSGAFTVNSSLITGLWLKDSNITAEGVYKDGHLFLADAGFDAAHERISLHDLSYTPGDQNLTLNYRLSLKEYQGAPYNGSADIYGDLVTKPKLHATLESRSLGGKLNANVTDKQLYVTAKDVSVVKLIAFSGKELPVTRGRLDAAVTLRSPALLDGNLSTLSGNSDINVSDLLFQGMSLDRSLKDLRDSQDLSLFQGSLFELPIVRSIKNIPSELSSKKNVNSTHITRMRFLTEIDKGVLRCKDCALATDENLIAMQGNADLRTMRFENFYVGLLHPSNCAYFVQQIKGKLSDPKVELATAGFNLISGAAISLIGNVGSVVDLGGDIIKGTGDFVGNVASYVPIIGKTTEKALTTVTDTPKSITGKVTQCTPFYSGAIKHPKPSKK